MLHHSKSTYREERSVLHHSESKYRGRPDRLYGSVSERMALTGCVDQRTDGIGGLTATNSL